MRNHTFLAAALVGGALSATAQAATPSYLGAWRIDSAVMAPWAYAGRSDAAEKARLLGKTVTLLPSAITGPEPFACRGPHYKLVDYGPDMLFQGALEEQHDANPKVTGAVYGALTEAEEFINKHAGDAAQIYIKTTNEKRSNQAEMVKFISDPDNI